jgi:hypothetical protein
MRNKMRGKQIEDGKWGREDDRIETELGQNWYRIKTKLRQHW